MKENKKKITLMIIALFFGMCIFPSIIGIEETPSFSNDAVVDASPLVIIIDGTYFIDIVSENNPPNEPIDPSPENNSKNISINPTISVLVTDPDNDTMNVSFYNALDDGLIGTDFNVSNGSRAEVTWSDLEYNTIYEWYAISNDSISENRSDTWTFTTKKDPHSPPTIELIKPLKYDEDKWCCYFRNKRIGRHPTLFIIGYIDLKAEATDNIGVERVEFYIDNHLKGNDTKPCQNIYQWTWNERIFRGHTIKVVAVDTNGLTAEYSMTVFIINFRFLTFFGEKSTSK